MTVRSYAALSLGEIGEKGGLKAVSDAFKRSKSRTFQAHAALALGIARESGSGPLLLKTLKRRALDDTTRAAVVLSAGLGDHQVVATRVAHEFKTRTDASTCSAASISMALLGDRNEILSAPGLYLAAEEPHSGPDWGQSILVMPFLA
jgi:HEAT repeat protein